jgi:hypothetical protein
VCEAREKGKEHVFQILNLLPKQFYLLLGGYGHLMGIFVFTQPGK